MNEHKIFLAENWLSKAETRYQAAQVLLESKLYGDASTKLYYAIYSVLRAIFAIDNITAKNDRDIVKHPTLIGTFNKRYVHEEKLFPIEFSAYIKKVEALRVDVDYGDMIDITAEDIKPHMEYFQVFFNATSEYIRKNM
ncbi:MAG: HEPN domain-containing protein [Defluviitaleaceae bacterium]|nr:HEPN domain-containing protein [Defluviitaleaceae bacterium]MCL2261810.1 HEPN domain-containing protein [Defluviitaleaceae bacterium]